MRINSKELSDFLRYVKIPGYGFEIFSWSWVQAEARTRTKPRNEAEVGRQVVKTPSGERQVVAVRTEEAGGPGVEVLAHNIR